MDSFSLTCVSSTPTASKLIKFSRSCTSFALTRGTSISSSMQLKPTQNVNNINLISRHNRFAPGFGFSGESSKPNYSINVRYIKEFSTVSSFKEEESQENGAGVAVVEKATWIDLYLPKELRPYARLARVEKQIGTFLLYWPCLWSITLAANPRQFPDVKIMAFFSLWSLIFRSAACTINDYFDRDFDKMVARTKKRPIANGDVTPFQALCFLGVQLFMGIGMTLQLNDCSRILGVPFLCMLLTYPLMKRITYWPQAYLSLLASWGALIGWSAVKGNLAPATVFPLYLSGVLWTLVYDTIYAHQDKEDDAKVGIKSTALFFGDMTKKWLTGFGIASIATLALSGFKAGLGWPFYASVVASAIHLAWQIWTVNLSNPNDCGNKFMSNKWYGAIVFGGILFGKLLS